MNVKIIIKLVALCSLAVICVLPAKVFSEIKYTPEGVIITHYPKKFDVTGKIDRIDDAGIVVEDRYFRFSSVTRFMTPRLNYTSRTAFEPGDNVGFVLDEKRQITVLGTLYAPD